EGDVAMLPMRVPTMGDKMAPRGAVCEPRQRSRKERIMPLRTRLSHLLLLAAAVLGVGFSFAMVGHVSAIAGPKPVYSLDCSRLETSFWEHSIAAGEAANAGDYVTANRETALANDAISRARAMNCAWPSAVFPPLQMG